MKVLIPYDGSSCSEAGLDDLVRAGLPKVCEVCVLSIAEVWLPPSSSIVGAIEPKKDGELKRRLQSYYGSNPKIVWEAQTLANHAKRKLQKMFPFWRIEAEATFGSPAGEVLTRVGNSKSDMLVIGSIGRSAISRTALGSISQKVLTEAQCSVRVARGRVPAETVPRRLVIGFDGSRGAQLAVDAVAARPWGEFSEIRLIASTGEVMPPSLGRFVPPVMHTAEKVNETELELIEKLAADALLRLQTKNIPATLHVYAGSPKAVLVEQADNWDADCIFVGVNAFCSPMERFALGSTAAAVAARAHCSVEVIKA